MLVLVVAIQEIQAVVCVGCNLGGNALAKALKGNSCEKNTSKNIKAVVVVAMAWAWAGAGGSKSKTVVLL